MPDNSFDVVSQIEMPEVNNAIQQAMKEITTRYDLKDSKSADRAERKGEEGRRSAARTISNSRRRPRSFNSKLSSAAVPIKNLTYGAVTARRRFFGEAGSHAHSGIPTEKAKDIVKKIKDSKLKVQASIQGDLVRISGKDRDTLQQAIALLKGADFGIDLQFINFRTN